MSLELKCAMGLHNRKGRVQRMRENDFSECYPHTHPLDTLEAREYMIIHWRILSGLRSTRTDVKIIRSLANVFDREKPSECICYVVSYMARVKGCKFANGSSEDPSASITSSSHHALGRVSRDMMRTYTSRKVKLARKTASARRMSQDCAKTFFTKLLQWVLLSPLRTSEC